MSKMKHLLLSLALIISANAWADIDDGYDWLFDEAGGMKVGNLKFLHCKTEDFKYELEKSIQTEVFYRLDESDETYKVLSNYRPCYLGEDCVETKNPNDRLLIPETNQFFLRSTKPIKFDNPTYIGTDTYGNSHSYYKTDEHLVLLLGFGYEYRIHRETLEYERGGEKVLGLFNTYYTYKCSLEQESTMLQKFNEYENMKSDLRRTKTKDNKL